MKAFVFLLYVLILLQSCKKTESQLPTNSTFQVGVYEGKYDDFLNDTTINKFQVEITKIDNTHFKVKEITAVNMPTFIMELKNSEYPFINFTIGEQSGDAGTFSGNGGVSGGFDAVYESTSKSLYFGFSYTNIRYSDIMFTGYKK